MIDQGIDIIAQHTDGPAALQVARERGIIGGFGQGADMSAFAPETQLTAIIDHWGPHYLASAKAVIDGFGWPAIQEGLKEDVVQMGPYNEKIPADVVADAERSAPARSTARSTSSPARSRTIPAPNASPPG